jgi:NAD(P)-dependent dehydrogenase (short-subunit alcohol dehydrogenase family)
MGRSYELEDKVVLITGAAHGIGRDAAGRLAERGARLALFDRDAEVVERAADEIGAEPFVADVGDGDSLGSAIAAARRRFGGIDVAIANAGVSGRPAPAAHLDDAEFARVVDVNLLGVWRTLRAVLPDVIERRGYLLPIASLAAAVPVPLAPAYGASKAGVHSLARTLRMELAHTGVRVGCGYFGFIDTGMTQEAFADPAVAHAHGNLPPVLGKLLPVGAAGAAIVRGVERRAKRVCAPRWVSLVVSLHGLGGPLEALVARDPRIARSLRQAHEAEQSPLPHLAVRPEETAR